MISGNVIGIDPGKHTGWSVFKNGVLFQAGADRFEDVFKDPPFVDSVVVVVEAPRHYPNKSKGDVNDLLDLSEMVGALMGRYRMMTGVTTVKRVFPRNWKGSVSKLIHNARTLEKLNGIEVSLLPKKRADARRKSKAQNYDHNMLDAVGLGLWFLGR